MRKLKYLSLIGCITFWSFVLTICLAKNEAWAYWSQTHGFNGYITQGVASAGTTLRLDPGKKYKFVVTWEPKEDEVMLWLRSVIFIKNYDGTTIGESYFQKTDTGGKLETEWTCTTNNSIREEVWASVGNKFQLEIYVWHED